MNIGDTPPRTTAAHPDLMLMASGSALSRSYRSGTQLGHHAHREAQLLFAASGIMEVTTPKGRWLVPPQRAVWLPPRVEHSVGVLADIEMRTLYVESAWLALHPLAPGLRREFVVKVGPLLRQLILALFHGGRDVRRDELLFELALFELPEAEDATTFIPLPADTRARRVADRILADPAAMTELDELARAAGASARTITRLFPIEINLTFREWRQRARILAAVEALSFGRTTVKQTAARFGFSSVAAFSHAFRQVMGTTPSEVMCGKHDLPG